MAEHSELVKLEDVSLSIGKMLDSFSLNSPEPFISKVPNYLRQLNEKAYEPRVISIGPYHRNKAHLRVMEQQKILFLKKLLEERSIDVSVYVIKMGELEDKARKCYAEPVSDLKSDDFVKMLLLDGVFLVQIIRSHLKKYSPKYMREIVSHYSGVSRCVLYQDIFLVENQLPFFVLRELFFMIESTATKNVFKEAIFKMLHQLLPGKRLPRDDLRSLGLDIKHLLDFMHHCCFQPSTSETEARGNPGDNRNPLRLLIKHLQDFFCHPSTSEMEAGENPGDNRNPLRLFIKYLHDFFCHPSTSDPEKNDSEIIRCATELQESGIKFKLLKGANTMFHIKFENGTLHIPQITIEDRTETFLRNLVAFEQLFEANRKLRLASDYMEFMDNLIDSPKDVEILCQKGIITNMLGDDEAVKNMINGLGVSVMASRKSYYTDIFKKVNNHCSRRWNRWMANLNHNYFNSPWALISVLAAALLLLLTVLQAVISVLAYLKQIRTS